MKRTLSVRPHRMVFISRSAGGVLGLSVGLFVLYRLQRLIVDGWVFEVAAIVMILVVGRLIAADLKLYRDLKHVAVDDHSLYVSDRSSHNEVVIPLDDIVRVTQRRGRQLRPVSVYLRSSSPAGSRIMFQPAREWGWAWREDAVVAELRVLARLDRPSGG